VNFELLNKHNPQTPQKIISGVAHIGAYNIITNTLYSLTNDANIFTNLLL